MSFKSFSVWFAFVLILPCAAGAADKEKNNLYDTWALALKGNEKIGIAEESYFRSRRDVSRAYSTVLPSVTLEGNYTAYNEKKYGTGGSLLQPENTSRFEVKFEQPLFGGGKEFAGIRRSKYLREGSAAGSLEVKEAVIIAASVAYFDYLNAINNLEIRRASLKRSEELLNAGRKNLSVGSVTKADVLRAEAEVATKSAELVAAEGDLYNAAEYYKRVTGFTGSVNLDPVMPDREYWLNVPEDEATLIEIALKNRKDYKAATLSEKAAKEGVGYVRGYFLPTITLEGSYVQRDQSPKPTEYLDEVVSGGVTVRYPIFEGGLRYAEYGQSKSNLREAELKRLGLRRDIELDVKKALNGVKSARSVKEAYGKQLEFAKENYDVVFKQYKYGLADNLDLIEAETTLVSAELNFSRSSLSHELSALVLRRSIGLLLEDAEGKIGGGLSN